MRNLFFAVLAALLTLTSPALAGEHPNFEGTWVLDLEASESVEPLLAAQGASWAERKLADSVVITQEVSQKEGKVTLEVSSVATNRTDVLLPGEGWKASDARRAETARTRCYWIEGGSKLVTETEMTFEDGEKATMLTTRSLAADGQTTIILIEFKKPDGTHKKAKRVLRKQAS